jgi:hypothetical protein
VSRFTDLALHNMIDRAQGMVNGHEIADLADELLAARRALRFEVTEADRDARMRTLSGWLHPFAPRPGEIQIRDIARGLAGTFRYRAQTRRLYNVAEHSVIVSLYVAPEHAREALLHDASEAYFGDMVGPVKAAPLMAGFRVVEDRLQAAIYAAFGVVPTEASSADVHTIDRRACSDEMPLLLAPGEALPDAEATHATHMLACRAKYGAPLGAAIPCLSVFQAEYLFLSRFAELFPELATE